MIFPGISSGVVFHYGVLGTEKMDLQKVLGESAASPNNHLADGNLEMLGF